MDSARSWLQKFQPRDKMKAKKKEEDGNDGNEDSTAPVDEASLSSSMKQKVAAAKQYIENHYKEQMKNLQERKERYGLFYLCLCLFIFIYQLTSSDDTHFPSKFIPLEEGKRSHYNGGFENQWNITNSSHVTGATQHVGWPRPNCIWDSRGQI